MAAMVDTRPNIIFMLSDDLGFSDLGTSRFGPPNSLTKTPALHGLASQGIVFPNAYSAPSCTPTRMALMTGLEAPRPGNNVYQVTRLDRVGGNTVTDLVPPKQGRANENDCLDPTIPTVAEVLKASGYRTIYVGKFHATADESEITTAHGFEVNYGGKASGAAEAYHASIVGGGREFHDTVGPGLDQFAADYTQAYVDRFIKPYSYGVPTADINALVGTRKHVTDAIADAMEQHVGTDPNQPTFTFCSQYVIHSPVENVEGRDDLVNKYRGGGQAGYRALVEGMDQSVARLRHYLETTPDPRNPGQTLDKNTVWIFTSDNGGRTDLGAENGVFSGQKGEVLEGGIRVPFFAWSANPGLVRSAAKATAIVRNVDMFPTLCDYAGVAAGARPPLDGRSIRPAITGTGTVPAVANVVHLPGYMNDNGRDQRPETTLRYGGWKVTYRYETRTWFLANLTGDPGETTNYRDSNTGKCEELANMLLDWCAEMKPPLATLRSGQSTVRYFAPVGTRFYRNREVKVIDSARDIVVAPGDEVPVILRPGVVAN